MFGSTNVICHYNGTPYDCIEETSEMLAYTQCHPVKHSIADFMPDHTEGSFWFLQQNRNIVN